MNLVFINTFNERLILNVISKERKKKVTFMSSYSSFPVECTAYERNQWVDKACDSNCFIIIISWKKCSQTIKSFMFISMEPLASISMSTL